MNFLAALLTAVFNLFMSRGGQLVLAFGVAWVWSWWRTDASWRAVIAAEKAQIELQYQKELARQAQAARDIAADATSRVEEEMAISSDLREKIARYADEEKKRGDNCVIDDDYSGVVQQLSPAASKAKPARAPAKLRKAR